MKTILNTILLLISMVLVVEAQTTSDLEQQIKLLQAQRDSLLADSTVTALSVEFNADSTMAANNIVLVNKPHSTSKIFDPMWVGIDFSQATNKNLLLKMVTSMYKGQKNDNVVRIHKGYLEEAKITIKDILQ